MRRLKTKSFFQSIKIRAFALIELLLVVAIIFVTLFTILNKHFKKQALNKESEKLLSEQGINTTDYKTILDGTKDKIQDLDRKLIEQQKALENIER